MSQSSAQEFAKKLVDQGADAVFKASDLDGDGTLNQEEFSLAIADQQMGFAKFEVRGWKRLERRTGETVTRVWCTSVGLLHTGPRKICTRGAAWVRLGGCFGVLVPCRRLMSLDARRQQWHHGE